MTDPECKRCGYENCACLNDEQTDHGHDEDEDDDFDDDEEDGYF